VERNLWPGRMLHICKLTISFKFHARHAETSQQQGPAASAWAKAICL